MIPVASSVPCSLHINWQPDPDYTCNPIHLQHCTKPHIQLPTELRTGLTYHDSFRLLETLTISTSRYHIMVCQSEVANDLVDGALGQSNDYFPCQQHRRMAVTVSELISIIVDHLSGLLGQASWLDILHSALPCLWVRRLRRATQEPQRSKSPT